MENALITEDPFEASPKKFDICQLNRGLKTIP